MKTLTIKPIFENESYADMIRTCLNFQPPSSGFSVEQMRKRMKILDKLEPIKAQIEFQDIELEDEEAKEVVTAIKAMDGYWARISKEVLAFCDDVINQLS